MKEAGNDQANMEKALWTKGTREAKTGAWTSNWGLWGESQKYEEKSDLGDGKKQDNWLQLKDKTQSVISNNR